MKAKKSRIIQLCADELKFDEDYQRKVIHARVRRLADKLDLDSLGVVTVSERKDGFYVVDGQHRILALRHHDFGEWKVKCQVYSDLKREEEAALFRTLNDTRRITPWDDFKAGIIEGDPESLEIRRICKVAGLRVSSGNQDGVISCVASMRQIYRNDDGRPGPEVLKEALEVAVAAWGVQSSSVEGKIIEGLSIVLSTYGPEEMDRPALIKKLSKIGGQGAGLLGLARSMREHRQAGVARCVASVVVDLYNKGRRSGALPAL